MGATGRTGRQVVTSGLAAGHDVVALVRRPRSFPVRSGLREIVWSDVADEPALAAGLEGADVVISALGGAEKGPTTVCTDAVRAAVPAMAAAGVTRLIAVSAHGVLESRDRSLYSTAVWCGVKEKLLDKQTMELLVVSSSLDWTLVRPPTLTDAAATGTYRVGDDLPIRLWHSIGRADLADFLVREAEAPRFVRRHPRIHR